MDTPPEGDIFFDFNDGIMRWTTIDADGDGYCWETRQNWGDENNRFSLTSASYDDLTQTALFPDNYLVTPYKLDCEQITFIAQAQDANHPAEHFGVAVSTTGNTDESDFTIIWEADMTAKVAGNWHAYDVDLREYQGQDIYIAIVHFNCTDQFMLNIDDITLHRQFDDMSENGAKMFRTYPNPVSDIVMIESATSVNRYEIYDVKGAVVRSEAVDSNSFEINVNGLPSGIYFIKTVSEGMTQTKRFIKK